MNFFSRFTVKLLDQYILKQIVDYFLLGVVVFTLVTFFSDAFLEFIRNIQKFGIPFDTALTMVGLQMPKMISYVIPASTFLAVLLVYNNLNNTFEIIAMRTNGISLYRLALPALILGLFSTALTYVLGDYVVPYCTRESLLIQRQAINTARLPIGRESFSFQNFDQNHNLRQLIYVSKYDNNSLKDTTFLDLSRNNTMEIIQSKNGKWYPNRWEFLNANSYVIYKSSGMLLASHSDKLDIQNLLSKQQNDESLTADDNNLPEFSTKVSAQSFMQLVHSIQKREKTKEKVPNITYINLWDKITLPLSCLVMILAAVPLAITPPRQNNNRGFVFSLGILFLFYLLRPIFISLGRTELLTFGHLIPLHTSLFIAAWAPITVIALIGSGLLHWKTKIL